MADWAKNGERQNMHPNIQGAINKKFTVTLKKRKAEDNDYKWLVEKILPAGHVEQNSGFLRRLELYENYLMD